ncbi:uncharacterized protein K441DRAFT_81870 [Cenococcum geophilum 1.58]|uniref:uncharacterized protein n=1 Tax=Cenococcum geophilum 1.58 TaxID=794803 RepID=UPI00358E4464|nr:hypothetical protein K441DRAFT_81870 [Cenococcum geophilum 1.58]
MLALNLMQPPCALPALCLRSIALRALPTQDGPEGASLPGDHLLECCSAILWFAGRGARLSTPALKRGCGRFAANHAFHWTEQDKQKLCQTPHCQRLQPQDSHPVRAPEALPGRGVPMLPHHLKCYSLHPSILKIPTPRKLKRPIDTHLLLRVI